MLAGKPAIENRSTLNANVMVGSSSFVNRVVPDGLIDGVVVDCAYNTKVVEKDSAGNNISKVYIGARLLVTAADLENLAQTINRHLSKTGYHEKDWNL